jgi:ABC-2 type transport system permease protein
MMRTLINAIWIAENDLRKSFKSIRNITWTFLFPVFMMFAFSFRLGLKGIDPEYMAFLIPGIVVMTAMFGTTNESMSIVLDRAMGTFDRILAAPVSSASIVLGKIFSGTVLGFISSIVLLILGGVIYGVSFVSIPFVLFMVMLACFSFTGIGTIVSGLASEPREANMMFNVLRFPLILLSGIFFPIESLPFPLQYVSRAFPLTYAAEAIRTFTGTMSDIVYIDIVVLVVYAAATVLIGSKILLKLIMK